MKRLTSDQARRIALGAQGLTDPRPGGRIDVRHFRRLFSTIGLLQLDSVNVLARSHYLPVLARLGPFDRDALDRYTSSSGEIFEYWGHAASLLRVEDHPLYRWRMEESSHPWRIIREIESEHPGYVEEVYDEIVAHGPMTVSDLADPGVRTGPWWGYGPGKRALEWLFAAGRITAYRDSRFTRLYDLPERVLPATALDVEPVPKEEAYRRLLLQAVRHHGVGTAGDLIDYHRLHGPTARPVIAELAASGHLEQVEVTGWGERAYLHPEATLPRRPAHATLLSPFDPVVWDRGRTERLFGFHYRIEIYVPKPQRVHGYYVLPFLLDGDLVARVDLKTDRSRGALLVQAAHVEPDRDPVRIAGALGAELRTMAEWLDVDDVVVAGEGGLSPALAASLG